MPESYLPGHPVEPRFCDNASSLRNPHEREAARLRSLLCVATTPALRTRLLQQAQEQERLAEELEELRASFAEAET